MGTSTSSTGPAGGVPLVPPWAPPPPALLPDAPPEETATEPPVPDQAAAAVDQPELGQAIVGRFGPARRALGDYGRTGASDSLRRGVGNYVSKGYSGARTTSSRFSGTATTAGALANVLNSLAAEAPVQGLDRALLSTLDSDALLDSLVEAVRQVDGTQDAEAERKSTRDALSDTLKKFPDDDPLVLSPEARTYAIERFVALDVFNRFVLDVGVAIQSAAPSPAQALARLAEARSYITQTVSTAFRRLEKQGHAVNTALISRVVRTALRDAFEVFEEYAQ